MHAKWSWPVRFLPCVAAWLEMLLYAINVRKLKVWNFHLCIWAGLLWPSVKSGTSQYILCGCLIIHTWATWLVGSQHQCILVYSCLYDRDGLFHCRRSRSKSLFHVVLLLQVTTDVVIHEVVEKTHLKLSHGDSSGVTSYLLTTETVRSGVAEEKPKPATDTANPIDPDSQLLNQLKEVRQLEDRTHGDPRHCYHQHITRHAVKGILWCRHDRWLVVRMSVLTVQASLIGFGCCSKYDKEWSYCSSLTRTSLTLAVGGSQAITYFTGHWCVPHKSMCEVVVSCAWELILLFTVVFCVPSAVHKFVLGML